MASYSLKKEMESYFDFGYRVTVDMENSIVRAFVYNQDDHDVITMSFIICDINELQDETLTCSHIIYITGVYCNRYTCFGVDTIRSFDEGNIGNHILRELNDIFAIVYPSCEMRLYLDTDFEQVRQKYIKKTLKISCMLNQSVLPLDISIDIAKKNLPTWVSFKHDLDSIQEYLYTLHHSMHPNTFFGSTNDLGNGQDDNDDEYND